MLKKLKEAVYDAVILAKWAATELKKDFEKHSDK